MKRIAVAAAGAALLNLLACGGVGDTDIQIVFDNDQDDVPNDCAVDEWGTVGGTVRNALGQPVEGAVLRWLPHPSGIADFPSVPVATNDEGRYRFEQVPAGLSIIVHAERLRHREVGASSVVSTQACEHAGDVDIEIGPPPDPGAIEGRLVDERMVPVAGMHLQLLQPESATAWRWAIAGEDGRFRFDDVPAGRHIVSVYLEAHRRRETVQVEVSTGEVADVGDMVLPLGQGSMQGAVVDLNGAGIRSAEVSMEQLEGGNNRYRTFTDSRGQFHQGWMSQGRYRVTVRHHMLCDHVIEEVAADGEFLTIEVVGGGSITGTAVFDAVPVETFRVVMNPVFGPTPESTTAGSSYRVRMHEEGALEVDLTAGIWDLAVVTPEGRIGIVRSISVECGGLTEVQVEMPDIGTIIPGGVFDAISGAPLEGARLTQTFGSAGLGPFDDGQYGGARTDTDGSFDLRRVPEEPFRVVVSAWDFKTRIISRLPEPGTPLNVELCPLGEVDCRPEQP